MPLQWQRSQPEAADWGGPAQRPSDLHAEDAGHRRRGGQARRHAPSQFPSHSLLFTAVHRRPSAGHPYCQGRWRTAADGDAQYSKACEGASLPWVQIPPPPPLTCDDASPPCVLRGGGHRGGLSFGPQMVSVDRAEIPCGWLDRTRTPSLHCGGHDLGGDPGGSLSVQVEALVQADAPAKPGAGFPVAGRAAEPMGTPPGRAPCCSGSAGTVRDRTDTRQLTDHITLSNREVLGERAPTRRYGS